MRVGFDGIFGIWSKEFLKDGEGLAFPIEDGLIVGGGHLEGSWRRECVSGDATIARKLACGIGKFFADRFRQVVRFKDTFLIVITEQNRIPLSEQFFKSGEAPSF